MAELPKWEERISEAGFQSIVTTLARLQGWLDYHTYDSQRSREGFPDLVLVRERVIFAELKAQKGKVAPAQREWGKRLLKAGAEVYLWRPSDLDDIKQVLARPRKG